MRHSGLKKLRGRKRYYDRLRQKAMAFSIDLRPSQWYDLWHEHFDWHGNSRLSSRDRAQHLSALFDAFRRALKQAAAAERPIQVFVSIAPDSHADQDALYVHTPNPNGTAFPRPFDGVQWDVSPPPFLRAFVKGEPGAIGAFVGNEQQGWWVVRPRSNR